MEYPTEFAEHVLYLKAKFAFEATTSISDIQDTTLLETLNVLYRVYRVITYNDNINTTPHMLKNIVSWNTVFTKVILRTEHIDYLGADLPWFMCRYFERNVDYTPTDEEWYSYTYTLCKYDSTDRFYTLLKSRLNYQFYYYKSYEIWQEYNNVVCLMKKSPTEQFTDFNEFVLEVYQRIRTDDTIPIEYKNQVLTNSIENTMRLVSDITPDIITASPKPSRSPTFRTYDDMMRIVERMTHGFITRKYLCENKGIVLSGGLISLLLSNTEGDIYTYLNSYRPDIDLFITASDETARNNALHSLIGRTASYRWHKRCFVAYKRTPSSLFYIFVKGATVPIQVVVSNFVNAWDMLNAFDMTHLQIGLTGGATVVTLPCILSQISYHTSIHPMMPVKMPRLAKAVVRQGYNLWIDDTVRSLYSSDEAGFYAMIRIVAEDMDANVRKYPSRWKLRRLLRFVNGCFTGANRMYVGEYPWYFKDYYSYVLRLEGDFRGLLFSGEYGNTVPQYHANYEYSDFPPIRLNPSQPLIVSDDYIPLVPVHTRVIQCFPEHYFIFKQCSVFVVPQNEDLLDIRPDTFENVFMTAMFKKYLHRITEAYGCNRIQLSETVTMSVEDINTTDTIHIHVFDQTQFYHAIRNTLIRIFPYHVSYATTPETLEVYFQTF